MATASPAASREALAEKAFANEAVHVQKTSMGERAMLERMAKEAAARTGASPDDRAPSPSVVAAEKAFADEAVHVQKTSMGERAMLERMAEQAAAAGAASPEDKTPSPGGVVAAEKAFADEVVHVQKMSMGEQAMLERMAAAARGDSAFAPLCPPGLDLQSPLQARGAAGWDVAGELPKIRIDDVSAPVGLKPKAAGAGRDPPAASPPGAAAAPKLAEKSAVAARLAARGTATRTTGASAARTATTRRTPAAAAPAPAATPTKELSFDGGGGCAAAAAAAGDDWEVLLSTAKQAQPDAPPAVAAPSKPPVAAARGDVGGGPSLDLHGGGNAAERLLDGSTRPWEIERALVHHPGGMKVLAEALWQYYEYDAVQMVRGLMEHLPEAARGAGSGIATHVDRQAATAGGGWKVTVSTTRDPRGSSDAPDRPPAKPAAYMSTRTHAAAAPRTALKSHADSVKAAAHAERIRRVHQAFSRIDTACRGHVTPAQVHRALEDDPTTRRLLATCYNASPAYARRLQDAMKRHPNPRAVLALRDFEALAAAIAP